MFKAIRRIFKAIVFILVLIIIAVCCIAWIPAQSSDFDVRGNYSDVMAQAFADTGANPRVADIAMLGAHDAFSAEIGNFSAVDPAPDTSMQSGVLNILGGGAIARYSRAQKTGAAGLLSYGVRYFDIRISRHKDDWYTKHGKINAEFKKELTAILEFLHTSKGEIVVLDFQHVYLGDKSAADFWAWLAEVRYEGKSIFDYAGYDATLLNLRYDTVTESGSSSGALIFAGTFSDKNSVFNSDKDEFENPIDDKKIAGRPVYDRKQNMRSIWHSTVSESQLINSMTDEKMTILADFNYKYHGLLRVNQAQKSPLADGAFKALFAWSLIDMAKASNVRVYKEIEKDVSGWLRAMPVVMVDYATSESKDFNKNINDLMIEYNKTL